MEATESQNLERHTLCNFQAPRLSPRRNLCCPPDTDRGLGGRKALKGRPTVTRKTQRTPPRGHVLDVKKILRKSPG